MAGHIKALRRPLSPNIYLLVGDVKRVYGNRDNKFRLRGPNALNVDEAAAHIRTARFSVVARAALKLLNLGIMTAEKLMKFNAIAWNAPRTSAARWPISEKLFGRT